MFAFYDDSETYKNMADFMKQTYDLYVCFYDKNRDQCEFVCRFDFFYFEI